MKKFIIKDKKLRKFILIFNKIYFILKILIKNKHIFYLIRYKLTFKIQLLSKFFRLVSLINKCLFYYNKKKFNKFTFFGRTFLLKYLQNGQLYGFQKNNW